MMTVHFFAFLMSSQVTKCCFFDHFCPSVKLQFGSIQFIAVGNQQDTISCLIPFKVYLCVFLKFLQRETTFVTSCLLSLDNVLLKKKEKELFALRDDFLCEGRQKEMVELPPLKLYPFTLKFSVQQTKPLLMLQIKNKIAHIDISGTNFEKNLTVEETPQIGNQ